jgi:glycosyltransferase involved in cell wall biosynthesis
MEKKAAFEYGYYEGTAIAEMIRLSVEVDLVHSHVNCDLVPFTGLLRAPALHTLHSPLRGEDVLWLCRRFPSAMLVSVSECDGQRLRAAGVTSVRTVKNGVDVDAFRFNGTHGEYLLFLARLLPSKGPRHAIEIARASGRRLVLAGPVEDRSYFAREIAPEIDGDTVRYVGVVKGERKQQLLREAAALVIVPAPEEPFGIVMLEAMACGTPVLALRRGAALEVVSHGLNGFVADETCELATLVGRLRELDRSQVRRSVQERYSHCRMVRDYLTLYGEILDRLC